MLILHGCVCVQKKELQLSYFSICEGKKLDDKIVTYFAIKAGSTVYSPSNSATTKNKKNSPLKETKCRDKISITTICSNLEVDFIILKLFSSSPDYITMKVLSEM